MLDKMQTKHVTRWPAIFFLLVLGLILRINVLSEISGANVLALKNLGNLIEFEFPNLSFRQILLHENQQQIGNHSYVPYIRQYALTTWLNNGPQATIVLLESSIDSGVSDQLLFTYLGLLEIEEDQIWVAAQTFQKVINSEKYLDNIGKRALQRHDWRKAVQIYSIISLVAPESAIGWNGIGQAYYLGGDNFHAEEAYEKALLFAPKDHESHYGLGLVLVRSGADLNLALLHLQQAVSFVPSGTWMEHRDLLELIRVQRDLGYFEDSVRNALIAVEKFPDSSFMYYELGESYRLLGRFELAIAAFQTAITLNPEYPQNYYALALSYVDLSENQLALEAISQSVALSPNNKIYLYEFGLILEKSSMFCDAASTYRSTLEIDKAYTPAEDGLKRLTEIELLTNCPSP